MSIQNSRYRRHRFPPEIISYAIWLYYRFSLSYRDIEDLLAERGIIVSYESIRRWCLKFGPRYQRSLKRREGQLGDDWYCDEVFVSIAGTQHYLWRAVDQDGDVLDILIQKRRDRQAAERFFSKLLKGQGRGPDEWRAMDLEVTCLPFGTCYQALYMIRQNMQTIAQRIHISTRVVGNDKCNDSNQQVRPSGFLDCMLDLAICFDTVDI